MRRRRCFATSVRDTPAAQPMLYRRANHPKPPPPIVSTSAMARFSGLRSGRHEPTSSPGGRDQRSALCRNVPRHNLRCRRSCGERGDLLGGLFQ